uniref:Uncharacterized protein n=1 Tax=Salarias fasciatus TaxID=181472 RepID=A0A672J7B2_SALFA
MEERTNSPTAVKVEEHSQYVILTYFHGDTNSMVDAHFSRALSKMCKAKSPAVKPKKARKPIKLGTTCSTFNTVKHTALQFAGKPIRRGNQDGCYWSATLSCYSAFDCVSHCIINNLIISLQIKRKCKFN